MENQSEITFLHYDGQCPWHTWMKEQVKKAAKTLNKSYSIINLIDKPGYSHKYRVFFPMMTVLRKKTRLTAPLSAKELIRLYEKGVSDGKTTYTELKPQATAERVERLTVENLLDTCKLCNYYTAVAIDSKIRWGESVLEISDVDILGLISYVGEKPVASVEVISSMLVPYPIPVKNRDTMFITCLYSLENCPVDYRGQLLDKLSETLGELGFKRINVLSGRRRAYPNGPVQLFVLSGYNEIAVLDRVFLREKEEEIVLMENTIN